MLTMLRKRLHKDDDGFTLIELMVVVLIIAILIAIAIPTFLGAQDRARDRGAQSNLRNAMTAAKVIATDNAGQFSVASITFASLTAAEGALTFGATAAATPAAEGTVSWVVTDASGATPSTLIMETTSASGAVFAICGNGTGLVKYLKANATVFADCTLAKW